MPTCNKMKNKNIENDKYQLDENEINENNYLENASSNSNKEEYIIL